MPQEDPKAKADQHAEQQMELSRTFTRLFGTPDGQVILGDLNQHFLVNDVAPDADHAYFSGCKAVMVYILNQTQQGLK